MYWVQFVPEWYGEMVPLLLTRKIRSVKILCRVQGITEAPRRRQQHLVTKAGLRQKADQQSG